MNFSLKRELPALGIVALPLVYLVYIWNKLPEQVPLHWNIHGEIDRYGSKTELLLLILLLPVLTYLLFLIIPSIDPKGQIKKMGKKYHQLKLGMVCLMSVLALMILYLIRHPESGSPNLILLPIGVLFTFLGNYMKTLKWNYFIGIRTPWTLENQTVWRETHKRGGVAFLLAGIFTVAASIFSGISMGLSWSCW